MASASDPCTDLLVVVAIVEAEVVISVDWRGIVVEVKSTVDLVLASAGLGIVS